ncbi:hypothetical protein BH11GEM1_BH11GEM1_19460 [soil metagenome]
MNLCWIVPKGEDGHVRDVDTDERAVLVRDGYEEFRLTCITPSGQLEGSLYDQASMNADDLACHVEKAGLALFGGCTTIQVHKPDRTAAVVMPHFASASAQAVMSSPTPSP